MIVIIVALSYVPGVADHETAFAATQPSSGRTSDAKGDIVLLTTERYKEYPMMIQGYGAGASVTAAGVFANIMSIANI